MKIELRHGAGGEAMDSLIKDLILKNFDSDVAEVSLADLDDSAVINGLAFSTDSYTVRPIFFPGGNIGRLAVSGTVNDLSVMGAKPLVLSSGMVVEEGFEMEDLRKIVESMREVLKYAGVNVVTGDFKVVEKGSLDKIIINTSGIGSAHPSLQSNFETVKKHRAMKTPWLTDSNLADGDVIISSGYIGDHGVAVLSAREGYGFESSVDSDVAPLNHMIGAALDIGGVVASKDPTRGGVANALNEWSEKSHVGIMVDEDLIPMRDAVVSACELLGIDPLQIGNEGKALLAVVPDKADEILDAMHKTTEGKNARIIGSATKDTKYVILRTQVGGERILEKPIGDPVPRIC